MDNPEGDFAASSSTGPASLAGSAALSYPPRAGRSGAASLRETLLQRGWVDHPSLLLPGSLLCSLMRETPEEMALGFGCRFSTCSVSPSTKARCIFGEREQSCSLIQTQPELREQHVLVRKPNQTSCSHQPSLRGRRGAHQSWRGQLRVPSSSSLPQPPASPAGERASRDRGTASAGTGCARASRALPSQVLRYPPRAIF